jgi:sulfonate transport system permease protein
MSPIQQAASVTWQRQFFFKTVKSCVALLCAFVLPMLVLCLWWTAFERQWLPEQILPAPEWVWLTTLDLWQNGDLQHHFGISAKRIFYSVLLGSSMALALGIWFALSKTATRYVLPTVNLIAQFPIIGWIPLLMIFLGIDEALKIVAISFAVFTPVLIATIKGIQNVPQQVLEVAKVYQFSQRQSFFKVILPSSLPNLMSGLRQGIMQAWLALVFVELLASSEGIGFLMVWGRQLMQMDIVFMAIVLIGITGFVLDSVLGQIEKYTRYYATRVRS